MNEMQCVSTVDSSAHRVGQHHTDRDVALITDGRFSGASHGIMVGHVTPEAADGGALAVVQDGDSVCIDLRVRACAW